MITIHPRWWPRSIYLSLKPFYVQLNQIQYLYVHMYTDFVIFEKFLMKIQKIDFIYEM